MSSNPIRVATTALSKRIYAGRPTKDGLGFKEPRYDVTSDVLKAVRDKIGVGNQVNVECDGVVLFRIAILPPEPASVDTHPQGGDATQIAAPFMSGAVPCADTADAQTTPGDSNG